MSQLPLGTQFFVPPGITAASETFENQFWFQHYLLNRRIPAIIDGSARDTGNTSHTKVLRQGFALGGPINTGGDIYKLKEWDITATDGSQFFYGFLMYNLTMFDANGDDTDRYCDVMVGGCVYSDYVIVPGNTALGISGNNGYLLPYMATERFLFDKHVKGVLPRYSLPVVPLATGGTLTAADSGRIFTNAGASGSTTIIPPDPLPGLIFTFMDVVGQNLVIDPALADCIVGPGNLLADTLTLTAGTQTGCLVEITGISTTLYAVTKSTGIGCIGAG